MSIDTKTAAQSGASGPYPGRRGPSCPALAQEFNAILGFIEQLEEVDVTDIDPMVSVTPMRLSRRVRMGSPMATSLRSCAEKRARRARGVLCRAEGGGMSDLTKLTIAGARDALRKGEVPQASRSPRPALTPRSTAPTRLVPSSTRRPRLALERAKAADQRIAAGDAHRRCAGSPWASRICSAPRACRLRPDPKSLKDFCRPTKATVSGKLKDAGAVMLGKLNMDEFAMGSSNETSVYGNAVNPWRSEGSNADADARRVLGRLCQRGCRPICAWRPPAPTLAGRSASPPPSPALSG